MILDGFLEVFGEFDDPVVWRNVVFDRRDLQVVGEVSGVTVGYRSCAAGAVRFGTWGAPCAFLHGLWRRFRYTSIVFHGELVGGVRGHDPELLLEFLDGFFEGVDDDNDPVVGRNGGLEFLVDLVDLVEKVY